MKLEFGRCPKCQSIIELNSNKIFICPYCEEKITKEDAKNNLDSELNDRIIASQITETINKAKKEQEKGNFLEASKLYHEVISINPYNIESYIGLIITKTDNFTKKPIIKNCALETINIKELEKIIEILSKLSKEDAKNNLDSELNDKIIASQITETINKAKKEQEKGNYLEASKLYHEVISINPYNIESYIGLIITKTDNFTKKPIIKNCTLETVNIKELEKIIEILSKLSKDEYSNFINQTKLYIDNYRKMVEEVEDNTLYIQLKMLNEDNNKEKEIKNPYVKKILYILCLIISIIIFVIEPIYGFVFLIISSITIGLLKK